MMLYVDDEWINAGIRWMAVLQWKKCCIQRVGDEAWSAGHPRL